MSSFSFELVNGQPISSMSSMSYDIRRVITNYINENAETKPRLRGRRALVVVFIKNMLFEIIAFVVFECL